LRRHGMTPLLFFCSSSFFMSNRFCRRRHTRKPLVAFPPLIVLGHIPHPLFCLLGAAGLSSLQVQHSDLPVERANLTFLFEPRWAFMTIPSPVCKSLLLFFHPSSSSPSLALSIQFLYPFPSRAPPGYNSCFFLKPFPIFSLGERTPRLLFPFSIRPLCFFPPFSYSWVVPGLGRFCILRH